MATKIYVNGTDKTDDVEYNSVSFQRETGYKPSILKFRLRNLTTFLEQGDLVELWEGSEMYFSGLVMSDSIDSPLPEKRQKVEVVDWYDALNLRLVRESYENKTVEEIVQNILEERVLDKQLRLMFQFEEGTGTAVADNSQHDNDGTVVGAGASWGNYYLEMDGSNGTYVTVPDDNSLDVTTELSIGVEVTMDVLNRTIICKTQGTGTSPSSTESPSNSPSESVSESVSESPSLSPSSSISPSSSESPSESVSESPSISPS